MPALLSPRRWLALLAATTASALAATTPNVLFIVVDDLNTDLGCYGHPVVKSPHIDRLAARGVRFEHAHSQYPLCNPSRASFLSGRRPETSGIYVLNTSARSAFPDAVLLPQFFRQKGYHSAGAGKVFHSARMSDPASWDFYQDGEGDDPQEKEAIQSRYGGGDGRPRFHILDGDGSRMRDGINTASVLGWIRTQSAAGKPWFLAAGYHKPHLPWTAPKRFFDLYPAAGVPPAPEPALRGIPAIALQTELSGFEQPESRAGAMRGYYACVSLTDFFIGQLLDELDRRDLWRNTVVVLVGDNGFHLGDHGGLWAKLSAFDAATRVPLIMAGAGLPAGRVVTTPVELLDIYPTLVDLSGFTPPAGLEGRSLRPLLQPGAAERHAYSLVYHYDVAAKRDVAGRTVIGPQWRYTEWDGGQAGREFYWHADDPREYHNRADDPALAEARRTAEALLRAAPQPKTAAANRPRALDPSSKSNR
jgi:uncharacterized sulfatase